MELGVIWFHEATAERAVQLFIGTAVIVVVEAR